MRGTCSFLAFPSLRHLKPFWNIRSCVDLKRTEQEKKDLSTSGMRIRKQDFLFKPDKSMFLCQDNVFPFFVENKKHKDRHTELTEEWYIKGGRYIVYQY